MITEMDIIKVKEFCVSVLDIQNTKLNDEYFYQSLPLCVIDSVYSIGVKYEGTRRTVIKYCDYYGLQRIRSNRETIALTEDQESIKHFIEKMEASGIRFFADNVFRNRQRTSARKGILKSEAVLQFAKTLQKYNVNYFQDVPKIINNADFENDIRKIKGQGSGISLKYFLMLCGSGDLIKPDRWIKEFINDAIAKQLSNQECQDLLSSACYRMKVECPKLTPRLLDNKIWEYQREKKEKGEKRNKAIPVSKNNLQSVGGQGKIITGRIVCPDTDRLEISIHKNQNHGLPLKKGMRIPITLLIDGVAYNAGVRLTAQDVPWICPDLYDFLDQKIRLVDALRTTGFEKGQNVFLTKCNTHSSNTFKIEHVKEEDKMSWWDVILEKINVENVLTTPGRGMEGLKKGIFTIEDKNSEIIHIHSGDFTIPIGKECLDAIERAFQQNTNLYLFVRAVHKVPAFPGSADELIRNATGSEQARGNYVCSMLEHCGLVQYEMRESKKVIVLPRMS
ncbi:hypothetical protein ASZ90_005649 [hydrocarbon metagenome]|uniref:Uncharacterized protein n=1 Tax=hydrocarbon metagenome TaxID=938273 RepID=A0A0W8FUV6_9ZZZZ